MELTLRPVRKTANNDEPFGHKYTDSKKTRKVTQRARENEVKRVLKIVIYYCYMLGHIKHLFHETDGDNIRVSAQNFNLLINLVECKFLLFFFFCNITSERDDDVQQQRVISNSNFLNNIL